IEAHGYVVGSKNSCGFTLVVFEEDPKPFTTPNQACALCVPADRRKEQHIALALMISLVMKMGHVLCQRMLERRFPKQNEPRETLLLDRPHPALRIGVQIWRPRRQGHPRDPGGVNDVLKGRAMDLPPLQRPMPLSRASIKDWGPEGRGAMCPYQGYWGRVFRRARLSQRACSLRVRGVLPVSPAPSRAPAPPRRAARRQAPQNTP